MPITERLQAAVDEFLVSRLKPEETFSGIEGLRTRRLFGTPRNAWALLRRGRDQGGGYACILTVDGVLRENLQPFGWIPLTEGWQGWKEAGAVRGIGGALHHPSVDDAIIAELVDKLDAAGRHR